MRPAGPTPQAARHQTITVHENPRTTPPYHADNDGLVQDCVIASPSTPYAHDLDGIAWTQSKFFRSFDPEEEGFDPWCADGLSTGSQDWAQSSPGADKTMQSSIPAATRDEHYDCRRWCVASPGEVLDANCWELLDHFASHIAPIMVLLDSDLNGYRSVLLQFACEDDLVRCAIMTASLYHKSVHQPGLRSKADAYYMNIIQRLRRQAGDVHGHDGALKVSTWATVVLLLVVENVSGGTNMPQVFRMLRYVADSNVPQAHTSALSTFLKQQTNMMTLFASSQLTDASGSAHVLRHPEQYVGFVYAQALISYPSCSDTIDLLKTAFLRTCTIYSRMKSHYPNNNLDSAHGSTELSRDVENLQQICHQICTDTPGHHSLVWVYFIAAAVSRETRHRLFFTQRLRNVFSKTGSGNILGALAVLDDIWARQSGYGLRWNDLILQIEPVFIM
ncbi:hypothetical protein LTR06_011212 [Exophiala xenobiotica]|nr:hypothetical protein LTR06_011212 [Exophiala xenobiotica]